MSERFRRSVPHRAWQDRAVTARPEPWNMASDGTRARSLPSRMARVGVEARYEPSSMARVGVKSRYEPSSMAGGAGGVAYLPCSLARETMPHGAVVALGIGLQRRAGILLL